MSLARDREAASTSGGGTGRMTVAATDLPVAAVAVLVPLAHLDRPFDYLVPERLSAAAQPGVRVRVRFAGRLVDALVLNRTPTSDHPGELGWLERTLGAEAVLTPEIAVLARLVADRWAGTFADVVRLALPPRHGATERLESAGPPPPALPPAAAAGGDAAGWGRYPGGEELLADLADGGAPRAVWAALPGREWLAALGQACAATGRSGRASIVVVPDHVTADLVAAALPRSGDENAVVLSADLPAGERYRRFLRVLHGRSTIVVGTRSAVFAPARPLGLIAVWDDGNDLHVEPRAPYPHVREVALLRAQQSGAGVLLGGHAVTPESYALVRRGWATLLRAPRAEVRAWTPLPQLAGSDAELARDPGARSARLPSLAWRAARDGLTRGPVLVQVPRKGYLPALACAGCRAPARCHTCAGPLSRLAAGAAPACAWCARPASGWRCQHCEATGLRAVSVGSDRTAEELGRAFPGVTVRTSGAGRMLRQVGPKPVVVVATPGAEPVCTGAGYAAVLLLDGWVALGRPGLRTGQEALRRWLGAAALAAPGAPLVVHADAGLAPVQALVRWDPAGYASRELAERAELRFPPVVRLAEIAGEPEAVAGLLAALILPTPAEVLGPVPLSGAAGGGEAPASHRYLVRVPASQGAALSSALRAALAARSAAKTRGHVTVRIDPWEVD